MSRSPKYSSVTVSDEVSRRLREENRRRAAERAAQRAAEAERRRKERLRRGQVALKSRLGELAKEVAMFDATPAGRHVAEPLRQLQARLAQIQQQTPGDEAELARLEKDVQRLGREVKQTIAQGEAAQDARELEGEAALVLQWKRRAAADRPGSRQFDPDGLTQFEAALRNVEAQLTRRDLAAARRAMTSVGQQFQQHRAEVEKRRSLWLTRKQASEAALARLQERIASLQSDPVVQRWEGQSIAGISERADQLTRLIERDQFEHATRDADRLLAETEQVLKAAEDRQRRQEKQDYIAESTLAALHACGFMVDRISEPPQGESADILIQVHRLDGRALAVNVPQEGAIQWSVDGFPMQVVAGSNGQAATVCDEAVDQIEAIQKRLSTDYGVETSELTWAGQDPNRPRKAAKRRPHHIQQYSQRTFRAQPK